MPRRANPGSIGEQPALLEKLYEAPGLSGGNFPPGLERLYDGGLGFGRPGVFANFVSSIDGVTALPSVPSSPSVISGKSEADRFVMGLLRACADIVLIGAGTLRAEPEHRWTPEFIYPEASDDYGRLRENLGLSSQPTLAVLTSSGRLAPDLPALDKAVVLTTRAGARHFRSGGHAGTAIIVESGNKTLDLREAVGILGSKGHRLILTEGGPSVIGQLLDQRLLDELFLTVSPVVMGRPRQEPRPGLAETDLLAAGPPRADVLSVRRHHSHLFLRYSFALGVSRQRERRVA